ncbi:MAG: DUF5119 domain-containing protein [Rikenellaceae bacterium]|nr:DUF5119 domain-containing protein [Rikenellaceae bacterium]
MRTIFPILAVVLFLSSCEHKDLCYNHDEHAHKYHIEVQATYRYEWEERCTDYTNWVTSWPEAYTPYDALRPTKPSGLRVINYDKYDTHHITNLEPDGGIVHLTEGANDLLFYNNDTEYIVFTDMNDFATTRATTRTRTRTTYDGNPFTLASEKEETVSPPDMLFGNFYAGYIPEKVQRPTVIPVTMHPLVFTYKIRFEFEYGLHYVSLARGALSGMARAVQLSTGTTSDEVATILFDCEMRDYGPFALVNSFGAPGYPNGNYATRGEGAYALNLEVMLRNGKIVSFDIDVTKEVEAQPHGGVIVVKGLKISDEDGMEGSVGGGFDVDVNDWGEYEDIDIPL